MVDDDGVNSEELLMILELIEESILLLEEVWFVDILPEYVGNDDESGDSWLNL